MDTLAHRLHDILLEGLDPTKVGIALVQPVEEHEYDPYTNDQPASAHRTILEHELSYNWLRWESEVYPKPTQEEFDSALARAESFNYQDSRRNAYPSIADQLDMLYHEGFDGWRAAIESVKQQFPKPE